MSNTKLTAHQNQQITEALCHMAMVGRSEGDIKAARRALVQECEEVNLVTSVDSLATLNMSR